MNLEKLLFKGIYHAAMRAKGISFQKELRELLESQQLSAEDLERVQLKKARELIDYASKYVPYYQGLFRAMTAPNIETLTDIQKLPTLTKEDLKTHPRSIRTAQRLDHVTRKTTAGSTGEPFSLWKDSTALEKELAATWRGYSWAGIHIGDRQGRFWGVPLRGKDLWRSKAIDFLTHRKRIPAFSFNEERLRRYTRELIKFRPHYLYGYVSMLAEYARYVRSFCDGPPFQLNAIVTTSEVLTTSERHLLESTFETKVFDEYGCAEFGTIAHQCEFGSMHIAAENLIVEVMDGERVCGKDETGELVITELSNRAMPMIRYRSGDIGSISSSDCSCGRKLPVLGGIEGRAWDMIERADGRRFHPAFFLYIFEDAKDMNLGVEHYKVYQAELDQFLIKIIPGENYSAETEAFIRGEVQRKFDRDAEVEIQQVREIPRELSGKLRQVVGLKDAATELKLRTQTIGRKQQTSEQNHVNQSLG